MPARLTLQSRCQGVVLVPSCPVGEEEATASLPPGAWAWVPCWAGCVLTGLCLLQFSLLTHNQGLLCGLVSHGKLSLMEVVNWS